MHGVLIVDDEELSRIAMRKLLMRLFPAVPVVGEARNGREAVNMAVSLEPEVVLMDIKIPAINGLDASALLLRAVPGAAVIIVSAYDNFSFAQRALNMGLAGYLLKPIREEEFAEVFRAALERSHPGAGAAEACGEEDEPGGSIAGTVELSDAAPADMAGGAILPGGAAEQLAARRRLRRRIEDAIEACPLPELGLEAVARRLGMNPQHLSRVFKLVFGVKFVDHVAARKIDAAKSILGREDLTVEELGRRIGWTDPGHLSHVFRERTGLTPKAYARQCRGG